MDTVSAISEVEALASRKGISMSAICREAGLDRSTVTKWKRGERRATIESYSRLCDALIRLSNGAVSIELRGLPALNGDKKALNGKKPNGKKKTAPAKSLGEIVHEIFGDVPPELWDKLPSDLSSRHDYYLYGDS